MFALGKKPARAGAVKFAFETFFSAADLPPVPLVFGKPELINTWGLLANDTASDCVQAGSAHETMLWRASAAQPVPAFTDANVLADYLAVNPGDTSYSCGTDLQEYAAYRQKTGIIDASGVRHKIDAYVALRPGDLDQLALAAFMFGAVGLGIQLPISASGQFDRAEPWSPETGSEVDGGHYVPVVGRNSAGNFLIITWGRLHAITPAAVKAWSDEGLAYLSRDYLRNNVSPRGYDDAKLGQYLAALPGAP